MRFNGVFDIRKTWTGKKVKLTERFILGLKIRLYVRENIKISMSQKKVEENNRSIAEKCKRSTAPSIPKRSPIQVLTGPDVA